MKEERISLLLGSHAHVPSGASESEFEYAYENKMRPFVSNLYRYSNIQAVLHYSGVLLYWVERTHPEIFMLIEDMVTRKQVELLGGGFYEPMFPLIPLQDRIGQIELMTTYLRKHFGKRPVGCWVPGMVWEQHLAAALGLIAPSIFIIIIIARMLAAFKENPVIKSLFAGFRPAAAGLLSAACFGAIALSLWNAAAPVWYELIRWKETLIFAVLFFLIYKFKKHPVIYIFAAGLTGIVLKL